jgi:putative chitinase
MVAVMQITADTLRLVFPHAAKSTLVRKAPFVIGALKWGKIDDPTEVAAYFAHVAKESGNFLYVKEIHDGSNYEGRRDLGNIYPGDGRRYPGRGDIQLTGRDVARKAGIFFGADFEGHPELMETDQYASLCSAYFWTQYKPWLPHMARRGWFHATQIAVNGGMNGWDERVGYYNLNLALFNLPKYKGIEDEQKKIAYFQAEKGLFADGIAGPKTWAAVQKG